MCKSVLIAEMSEIACCAGNSRNTWAWPRARPRQCGDIHKQWFTHQGAGHTSVRARPGQRSNWMTKANLLADRCLGQKFLRPSKQGSFDIQQRLELLWALLALWCKQSDSGPKVIVIYSNSRIKEHIENGRKKCLWMIR